MFGRYPAGRYVCFCLMEEKQGVVVWAKTDTPWIRLKVTLSPASTI